MTQLGIQWLGIYEPGVQSGQTHRISACGPESRYKSCVDASRKYLHYGIQHLWSGHPQPVHETALNAALSQEPRHLLPSAVDDNGCGITRDFSNLPGQAMERFRRIDQCSSQLD